MRPEYDLSKFKRRVRGKYYVQASKPSLMAVEHLARFMHDEYEKQAREVGWQSQETCRVSFNDLPDDNRQVMLKVAEAILARWDVRRWSPDPPEGLLGALSDAQDCVDNAFDDLGRAGEETQQEGQQAACRVLRLAAESLSRMIGEEIEKARKELGHE